MTKSGNRIFVPLLPSCLPVGGRTASDRLPGLPRRAIVSRTVSDRTLKSIGLMVSVYGPLRVLSQSLFGNQLPIYYPVSIRFLQPCKASRPHP